MNNIIAPEQGRGKPGTWGCIDQLLVNKHITNEVKSKRRNLCVRGLTTKSLRFSTTLMDA